MKLWTQLWPLLAGTALLAFTLAPQQAHAGAPVRTVLDGQELKFDVPAIIENDRTLVPMRGVLEPLGADIAWDAVARSVTAKLGTAEVKVVMGVRAATVNGSVVPLDVAPRIQSDRTLIPLRFFAENLGFRVSWEAATRTIRLESGKAAGTASPKAASMAEAAAKYVGAPYAWGGTNPLTGFDCSGFIYFITKQFGVEMPRTSFEQFRVGVPVERARLSAGDLVFFSTYAAGASHAGVYDGKGNFIHAGSEGKGVLLTPLTKVYWSERFLGGRRILR